ncbi:peroxisome biogenesis protein 16-like [Abrus precatorius]|uniref:Peroxisomal membrane protein PEX16 n=1 Tax=Abrus precatorius TaxID=3816 RepID=A0A8B8JRI8_ABRPR|nr:peroxisome biogenesis protein 16-like [Abrus precatorius]XP_027334152.1 peroxisome biogenesis protein 16-like [Abrus precatorius]
MEAYKRWVRQNKDFVHSLESLANGLTWLLPERFSESEIGPEAVTTILGIVTAINEHIIDTAPGQNITGSVEPYSFPYPLCLSALKDLETLVEVVAQHYYGDDKKWNFLAVTEAIKALVRLSLFRKSGYKMLLHGGETPNDEVNLDSFTSQYQVGLKPDGHHRSGYLNNNLGANPMNLEGRALSALNRFGEKARMVSDPAWLRRVQHKQATMKPTNSRVDRPTLCTILSKKGIFGALFLVGEVLFISRPLIYVLFIRKYGVRSWSPWLLSLAIDCIGNSILSLVTTSLAGEKEQMFHLSAPEKDEVKRRKLLFVLYLMRDPFFSKYTRQKLESTEKVLEPIPIIGFLTAKIVELMIGAQTRYTYMSGS